MRTFTFRVSFLPDPLTTHECLTFYPVRTNIRHQFCHHWCSSLCSKFLKQSWYAAGMGALETFCTVYVWRHRFYRLGLDQCPESSSRCTVPSEMNSHELAHLGKHVGLLAIAHSRNPEQFFRVFFLLFCL